MEQEDGRIGCKKCPIPLSLNYKNLLEIINKFKENFKIHRTVQPT
jgi:hypothetical protein